MKLLIFIYIKRLFIVQAYLRNEFANICEANGEMYNVDFISNTIHFSKTPSLEQNKKSEIINLMKSQEIKKIIDDLFNK